jgi:hypothetical protein
MSGMQIPMEGSDMQDENTPITEQPDQQRRRFTKGGLAAPIVLATLVSKPVLGASYHCTVSGKLSGNTSAPHGNGDCDINSKTPDGWKTTHPSGWPPGTTVLDNTTLKTIRFNATTPAFSDKYKKDSQSARLLDILNGSLDGSPPNLVLGKEAVAAYLNSLALGAPAVFPLSTAEVVRLFNGVIDGGTVVATSTFPSKFWDAAKVLTYFKCINGSGCPVNIPALP